MQLIAVAVAALILASGPCPTADPKAELLSIHETARQDHLRGDASLIARTIATGSSLLKGTIRIQSKAEVAQFFAAYFNQVRHSQWRDVSSPSVSISPDWQMAWMAVEVEAKYTRADRPLEREKSFKSSWIAAYERDGCGWRMTGIASDVVE